MSCFKSVKISYIARYAPDFRGALSKKNPAHYLKVIFEQFLKERISFFKRLETIYYNCNKENFRHFYSDIFPALTLIDGDPGIGSLDVLAQNMQAIKEGYIPKNKDENRKLIDIRKEIVKLYDHTNLDIARINYTKTMTNDTMSELAKNKLLVRELENKVKESEEFFLE